MSLLRPKPLCPVGDRTLLDHAIDSLLGSTSAVAVNAHHGLDQIQAHVAGRVSSGDPLHLSVEASEALGTAGAIGQLRDWLDGRGALIVNADTWHRIDLGEFANGWDGERVRVLTTTPLPFAARSSIVASILPWWSARTIPAEPAGLWELIWRSELEAGRLDEVHSSGTVVDCATPADYLRANLTWSDGESVIGEGAVVEGTVERTVVWPGSVVEASEHLVDAIRADARTVLIR